MVRNGRKLMAVLTNFSKQPETDSCHEQQFPRDHLPWPLIQVMMTPLQLATH
jgi:hypothetical protein